MIITRRSFLRGLLAAPIIVAAPSLMKVRVRDFLVSEYKTPGYLEIEGINQWGEPMREVIPADGAMGGSCGIWRSVTSIRAVPFRDTGLLA